MFRVSSKGRYAVKAIYELALHAGHGPLTVGSIATAQNIPEQYLEQLMPLLKRAGLVRGMRGAQGGYQLAGDPAMISVRDVVQAVEGPIVVAECAEAGPGCLEMDHCIGPDIWTRVQEAVDDAMSQITLDRLVREQGTSRGVAARVGGGG
ncbi:RrF2 family transcriptional regulator [Sulfobacillus harzensis]|uniref:Rrf2 family transcriptional regulator n=1 Tax=Sulfobacillus harzensis TaxID=2729629 RepID=A0A7Y0Q3S7_9FIRM|nr:Rrf2 family transcriptional regulator [Sulfobacillus harzensis]NMP22489.1 Rrf2 family transcriptional regulator [Sulfobacillus harzensis]